MMQARPSPIRTNRSGFTLVEMLLAMVLSAVLVTALMSVAAASAKDQQRLRDDQATQEPPWFGDLARQIESDLLMGQGVSGVVYINELNTSQATPTLYILTHHDSGPGSTSHLPVLVSYQLIQSEGQGVLIRSQQPLTNRTDVTRRERQRIQTDVMVIGVQDVAIGAAELTLNPEARQPSTPTTRAGSGFTLLVGNRPVAFTPITGQMLLTLSHEELAQAYSPNVGQDPTVTYRRQLITQ